LRRLFLEQPLVFSARGRWTALAPDSLSFLALSTFSRPSSCSRLLDVLFFLAEPAGMGLKLVNRAAISPGSCKIGIELKNIIV